jgi:hypothetical protein
MHERSLNEAVMAVVAWPGRVPSASVMAFTSPAIQHQEQIAALAIVEGLATAEAAQTLRDEMLYHRATQTFLWASPLLNTLGMQAGFEKTFGEGHNVSVIAAAYPRDSRWPRSASSPRPRSKQTGSGQR